jgi:Flp pilus assembly protein CpaB
MTDRSPTPSPETSPNWAAGVRRRMPFYIIIAILLAVLAGGLTFTFLEQLQAESVPTGQALIALQDIRPGAEITANMVEVRRVPIAQLPRDAATDASQAVGRVAALPIVEGEVIIAERLAGTTAESGLSSKLPDGRWALVLTRGWLISPVPAVKRGDRVDLVAYATGDPRTEAGVVVSAVEIIDFSGSSSSPESLTLAVDLDQAITILFTHVNGFNILPLLRPEGS